MNVILRKFKSAGVRLRRAVFSQRFGFSPSQIYGHEFYHGCGCSQGDQHASVVARMLQERFHPSNMFDFGSGNGTLLREMRALGVTGFGCEGSEQGVGISPSGVFVFQADLKRPVRLNTVFDLTTCIEVAEHLPRRSADVLVQSIAAATGKTLVFSAARPGQLGDDHINLQPLEYWIEKFSRHQLRLDDGVSKEFHAAAAEGRIPRWYGNTIVMHRIGDPVKTK